MFSPDPAEVALARRVMSAIPNGSGVLMIDGKMQDDASFKQSAVMASLADMLASRDPDLAERYAEHDPQPTSQNP